MEDSLEVQQQHQQLDEAQLNDDTEDAEDDQGAYQESSEDEQYNQKNFGIYQALPVQGEPDWSLGKLTGSTVAMLAFWIYSSSVWSPIGRYLMTAPLHRRGT